VGRRSISSDRAPPTAAASAAASAAAALSVPKETFQRILENSKLCPSIGLHQFRTSSRKPETLKQSKYNCTTGTTRSTTGSQFQHSDQAVALLGYPGTSTSTGTWYRLSSSFMIISPSAAAALPQCHYYVATGIPLYQPVQYFLNQYRY
jgi:hypothetical protein